MTFYAWHSDQQAAIAGTSIYLTVNGDEVEASMVSPHREHGAKFTDMVYLGEVVRWLRRGRLSRSLMVRLNRGTP
jgi:hypothetical protein